MCVCVCVGLSPCWLLAHASSSSLLLPPPPLPPAAAAAGLRLLPPPPPPPFIREAVVRGDRIMGFGHRVYKTLDPRSELMRETAEELGGAIVDFAEQVEQTVVRILDELKPGRQLYTNVEFYAGVVMELCRHPTLAFHTYFRRQPDGWLVRPPSRAGGRQPDHPAGLPLHRPSRARAGSAGGLRTRSRADVRTTAAAADSSGRPEDGLASPGSGQGRGRQRPASRRNVSDSGHPIHAFATDTRQRASRFTGLKR